jgi:hypothetical protein
MTTDRIAKLMRDIVYRRSRGRWQASPRKMIGAYGYGRTKAEARAELRTIMDRPTVDISGPRHAALRRQLANPGRLYSARESQALMRWMVKGGPVPDFPDSPRQRKRLGLGPRDLVEYHFTLRRPLTPEERRHAEDRQVLEAVTAAVAATLKALVGRFRDSRSTGDLILDWGGRGGDAARRTRLRLTLSRLRAGGAVRVVGRRWVVTREGYRCCQQTREGHWWKGFRWERHRRDIALTPAGSKGKRT